MAKGKVLRPLRISLEEGIENLRQIQIVVSDFQQQGQPVLDQKLQNIVTNLKVRKSNH